MGLSVTAKLRRKAGRIMNSTILTDRRNPSRGCPVCRALVNFPKVAPISFLHESKLRQATWQGFAAF